MQGVITLIFSQILIKMLGLIYTLYLTNKEGFGDKGNGIVSASYQIYALLLTISSIGVPSAISKLVSEKAAIDDYKGAHRIFKIAFATFCLIGLAGSIGLFLGANVIANIWLEIPETEMTLVALSPAIFFVAISSVFRGYFNGMQNVNATAKAQSIEQLFKTALTIIIVEIVALMSNVSTELMAAGATLATTLATFVGFAYSYLYYQTRKKYLGQKTAGSTTYKYERVRTVIKKILMVSVPITLTAIMSSLNKNIDSFTVVRSLKAFMPEDAAISQYGILGGKVDMLTSLPLSINVAFATALVPAIAAAKAKNDTKTIKEKTSFSLLVSMIIGLACTVGMCLFSEPILKLLFPRASDGAAVLAISSVAIIFTILAQTCNASLQGYGKLKIPVIAFGSGVIVKLILNIVLVPIESIGVNGAAIGSVACHVVAFSISMAALKKHLKVETKINKFVIKPILAVVGMAIISLFTFLTLERILGNNLAIIITMIVAAMIYTIAIMCLNIFSKEEILSLPKGRQILNALEKFKIY